MAADPAAVWARGMIVLGIETTCDETAVAVVDGDRAVRANLVFSQLAEHAPYGGVVPEVAARAHLDRLDGMVAEAMAEADLGFAELDGVAVSAGPGLIGGLLVGVMTAKAIALVHRTPLLAVNHLEGHALSVRLSENRPFPYLLLLVTGGHCQLLIVRGVAEYRRLGTTLDDAVGEAFDKAAKMLGLGYPGGPAIERAAARGEATRFPLPRPLLGRPGCHFSFSGLKTALRRTVETLPGAGPTAGEVADLAASFQAAVGDVLCDRTANALEIFGEAEPHGRCLVVAGGVAANATVRARLGGLASSYGFECVAPPPALCTDNAAMIAWAGIERLALGLRDELDCPARARWPLDADAPPAPGAGVKA